ncbi:hypothetical protein BLNAU_7033 [Blattamonas nauphoetae]|uniref:Uncharacterized protein n=1 Tax=Blattamonas nauphoetae TaxID=2049346 RepID=A0ABQ9Y2Y7_9EUKA|nr:hypothetical protein BLNAU_7033 [Blattamonas nauphoetae]
MTKNLRVKPETIDLSFGEKEETDVSIILRTEGYKTVTCTISVENTSSFHLLSPSTVNISPSKRTTIRLRFLPTSNHASHGLLLIQSATETISVPLNSIPLQTPTQLSSSYAPSSRTDLRKSDPLTRTMVNPNKLQSRQGTQKESIHKPLRRKEFTGVTFTENFNETHLAVMDDGDSDPSFDFPLSSALTPSSSKSKHQSFDNSDDNGDDSLQNSINDWDLMKVTDQMLSQIDKVMKDSQSDEDFQEYLDKMSKNKGADLDSTLDDLAFSHDSSKMNVQMEQNLDINQKNPLDPLSSSFASPFGSYSRNTEEANVGKEESSKEESDFDDFDTQKYTQPISASSLGFQTQKPQKEATQSEPIPSNSSLNKPTPTNPNSTHAKLFSQTVRKLNSTRTHGATTPPQQTLFHPIVSKTLDILSNLLLHDDDDSYESVVDAISTLFDDVKQHSCRERSLALSLIAQVSASRAGSSSLIFSDLFHSLLLLLASPFLFSPQESDDIACTVMNCCVRTAGKDDIAQNPAPTLQNLLSSFSSSTSLLSSLYTLTALFSLLHNPAIHQFCRDTGFGSTILKALATQPKQTKLALNQTLDEAHILLESIESQIEQIVGILGQDFVEDIPSDVDLDLEVDEDTSLLVQDAESEDFNSDMS